VAESPLARGAGSTDALEYVTEDVGACPVDDGAGPAGAMEDAFTPLTLEGVKETVENLAAKLNSAMDTETPLKDLWLAFQHWLHYVIIVCFVAYFVARMEQRRHARRLRAAKSAMSFARTRDATYTSVETGMLEWINHALRHEWRAVVGAYVDQIATQSLEETLRASETATAGVTIGATVEELTFGVVPPDLKMYCSRYNPTEDYLHFEFDLNWQTVSSLIVLRASVKPSPYLPRMSVPVSVTDLSITGRLLVGFRLANRSPGVSGVDVSFETKPEIHVAIKPAGFAVSDLPGVHEWVTNKIATVFATSYVEPKRYTYDFENAYLRSMDGGIAAASGPGGALVVDVAGAVRLPATNKESRTSNPYCELTYGGITRRTATRLNTTSPEWNVRLVFPLPGAKDLRAQKASDKGDGGGFGSPVVVKGDKGSEAANEVDPSTLVGDGRTLPLRVRVMDWSPLGEPRCIGEASYAVDTRRLHREANDIGAMKAGKRKSDAGGPLGMREVSLPLRRTKGGFVKLILGAAGPAQPSSSNQPSSSEQAGSRRPSRRASADGNLAKRAIVRQASGEGRGLTRQESLTAGELELENRDWPEKYVEDDEEPIDDWSPRDSPLATPTSTVGTPRTPTPGAEGDEDDGDAHGGAHMAQTAAHILQMAKIQRSRREDATRHKEAIDAMRRKMMGSKEDLRMERDRREFELRRALVEGAVFTCHTKRSPGFTPGTYRIWFNSKLKRIVWSAGRAPGRTSKLHQFVPVSLIKECVVGSSAFTLGAEPEGQVTRAEAKELWRRGMKAKSPTTLTMSAAASARAMMTKKIGTHDPLRCFSIVLWKPEQMQGGPNDNVMESGAASLGLATIDLELPQEGNGRSVREWCEAIYAAAVQHGGGKGDDEEAEEEDEDEASAREGKYWEAHEDQRGQGQNRENGGGLHATPPKSASRRTESKELIEQQELIRDATHGGKHAKRGSMGIPLFDSFDDSVDDLVAAAEESAEVSKGGAGRDSPQTVMTPPDGSTPGASGGSGESAEEPPPQPRVQPRSEVVAAGSPGDRL